MNHHGRFNPIRILAVLTGLCLLLGAVLDPGLFRLDAQKAAAVGGYDAVNVLGPDNFTGEGTWELVFVPPTNAILEFAHQTIDSDIIWAVTEGDIYYCDTGTLCDEEADWITYTMSDTLSSIAVDQDITHVVLYVGTFATDTEILRCDVGLTGCDEESDWTTAFTVDLYASDNTEAIISAGGFMFAGVNGGGSSGPTTTFRCDLTTDCDTTVEWTESRSSEGGRAWQFMFDEANSVLYMGRKDGSSTGHVKRCDLATLCDEDADWFTTFGKGTPFHGLTKDEANEVIYLAFGASGEGGDEPGAITRCDITATGGCDDSGDWDELDTDGVDITSIIWEPVDGFLFAGAVDDISTNSLYRCDTATLCDDFADFEFVSSDAGQTRFVSDTANDALFSGGAQLWRCELSTGCGIANELDQTDGVAYDVDGERFFVSDFNRHRVLIYDLSDGLDDGEEPVNVLGQINFTNVDCNDGNGPGDPDDYTFCTPQGLAYDETNDRLFVNDYNNNRTMVFDLSGLVTNGMPASFVLGQPDFFTTDCETDQTSLCGVQNGVVYDNDGVNERLFVADISNERVMVFDVDPGAISNGDPAINVIGKSDFVTAPGVCPIQQSTTCFPFGLALDGVNQVLFVSDSSAHRVTTFNVDIAALVPNDSGSDGPDAVNVLGQDDFTTVGCDTSATGMCNPTGMSYDSASSRLFVSEQSNNRVTQFDTTTIEDGEPAVDVYGQDDLDSAIADMTQSSLNIARDVVYMPDLDYIAISDSENHRIMFFEAQPNPAGGGGGPTTEHEATDVVGQLDDDNQGKFDKSAPNNGPNDRGFNGPKTAVVDTVNHRLFVADVNHGRVLVFNLDVSDNLIDHIPDNVLGRPDFTTEADDETIDATTMFAMGLAYSPTDDLLYAADFDRARVLVFDVDVITNNEPAINVLGQDDFFTGTPGLDQFSLESPHGLALDDAGDRLFVADQDNERTMVFDVGTITDGEAAINVIGAPDFDTDGYDVTQNEMAATVGLAYDSATSRLFALDAAFNRVMVFDADISVLVPDCGLACDGPNAINIIGQDDFTSTDSGLSADRFNWFSWNIGVVADPAGQRLFVGDPTNHRVLVFDIDESVLVPLGPSDPCAVPTSCGPDAINVLGQDDFTSNTDTVDQASIRSPSGMAYAGDRLYVGGNLDTDETLNDHRVMIFDVDPAVLVSGCGLLCDGPNAVDMVGQLDDAGLPKYSKNGPNDGPNLRGFEGPNSLALDRVNGRLFVSDGANNRILVHTLNPDLTLPDYIPDFVLGQINYTSGNPGTSDTQLNGPSGLSFDDVTGDNLLYVADANNNRVVVFDVTDIADGEPAVSVLGQDDFDSGDCNQGGGADAGTLCNPADVSIEPLNGILAVADADNNRALLYDVSDGIVPNGEDASVVYTDQNGWTTAFNPSAEGYIFGLGRDSVNQVLYAGSYTSSIIYRCDIGATDCDEDADFAVAYDTPGSQVNDFVFDPVNEVIYAGNSGNLFRCDTATAGSCDDAGDWTTVISGGGAMFPELLYHEGLLFMSGVFRCDTSTGCDTSGEWVGGIPGDVITVDTVNDVLYTGSDGAIVNRCDITATDCDAFADSAEVFDADEYDIEAIFYDVATAAVYVGVRSTGTANAIWRCDTATGCDEQTDWTQTYQNDSDYVQAFGADTTQGIVYAGTFLGNILACDAASDCDEASDWHLAFDAPSAYINDFEFDDSNGVLYSGGSAGDARVYRCDTVTEDCDVLGEGLNAPRGVLVETNNDTLWVADTGNNRVLGYGLFPAENGQPYVVLGQPDFDTGDSNTSQSGFDQPQDISLIEVDGSEQRLFVSDYNNSRVMVFDSGDGLDNGEDAVDAYGQETFGDTECDDALDDLCNPVGLFYDTDRSTLWVADRGNNRVMIFGPEPPGGGGGGTPPTPVGFTPGRIIVNDDDSTTNSRNVLVDVYATTTGNFVGTVDVLLSNTPEFTTFVPFRYAIPERLPNGNNTRDIWPKTIAWDLCFGLTDTTTCKLGIHTVYARFYVNVPAPTPALVRPTNQ